MPCRGIGALLVPIGAKGRGIKGNQGGPAALGAIYSLDAGMQARQRSMAPGDQTEHFIGVSAAAFIVLLPGLPDGLILCGQAAVIPEGQIPAFEQILPILLQSRMGTGLGRIPGFKKAGNRTGSGRIRIF